MNPSRSLLFQASCCVFKTLSIPLRACELTADCAEAGSVVIPNKTAPVTKARTKIPPTLMSPSKAHQCHISEKPSRPNLPEPSCPQWLKPLLPSVTLCLCGQPIAPKKQKQRRKPLSRYAILKIESTPGSCSPPRPLRPPFPTGASSGPPPAYRDRQSDRTGKPR